MVHAVRIVHPTAADQREFLAMTAASRAFHVPWAHPPRDAAGYRELLHRAGRDDCEAFLVRRTEDDALVTTVVQRPGSAAFTLDWRVAEVNGQPRIVDLVAEGASLRLTQRSEYSAVIQRGGNQVGALLNAMRQQIAQLSR